MASYGYTFNSGDGVTPTRLNAARTVSDIVDADIKSDAAIALSKLATGALPSAITVASANLVDGTIVNADINASAAIAHTKIANITSGQVLLGNASNVPTATAVTGDVTISNTGVTAIGAGVIVDADVNASAAIALSKLATGALPTAITVASANIVDGTIVNADINASAAIADTKLDTISTAGKVSNSATTATNANTASAIVARDASGNFSAGTITAALSGNVTGNVTGTASAIADGTVSTAKIVDGNVTTAKLATVTQQSLLPAGAVMPFAMNSAPAGWLAANGAAVSRSTYAALFAAISTTHGVGDGSTTFNLPDLRGIFVRGSGEQTISGTTYNKAFALKEADELKSHNHTVADVNTASNGNFGAGGLAAYPAGTLNRTTSSTGGAETRPANIALLYCIKF